MNLVLSLVTTGIALVFAAIVYRQYIDRWRPYQLVWSIALLVFAIGTFSQFVAERNGWSAIVYRVWYYSGAMLAAAYLGQGTVYLLAPRRVADVSMLVVAALSLVGLALVWRLPVDLGQAVTPSGITGNGFPPTLLALLIPLNTYGTIALVGGALLSTFRYLRLRKEGRLVTGTLLIAAGGLIAAFGGTANRLGVPGLLYLTEIVGLAGIFAGYLQTTTPRPSWPIRPTRPG